MKIGLLTTSFPRAAEDAAGRFVLGFARALAERGHTIDVLAPAPRELHYEAPPSFAGVSVSWVPYLPRAWQRTFYGAGVLDNLRMEPLSAAGLVPFTLSLARATRAKQRAWDAVISHWALPCALIAGELARSQPHLAVLHSADVFLLEQLPLRRALATRIARQADALLFSTRDLRRRFLSLLAPLARAELSARAHVCAMGIEPTAATGAQRSALRAHLRAKHFTLLSMGRLIPLKGVVHAIEAVALLPDVELVIAGSGPEREALEQTALRRGANVRFVGALHGQAKIDWLRAADAFVLPSTVLADGRTEGMPNTVLEAMEEGLAVIASQVGGIADVVHPGENGLLVPPADPQAIAAAVRTLMQPSLRRRLSKGARETAALYHWSNLAPQLEALLRTP